MQTRIFRGQSTKEVLAIVKEELGEEAVIVNTRFIPVTSGSSIHLVEVVARTQMAQEEISYAQDAQRSHIDTGTHLRTGIEDHSSHKAPTDWLFENLRKTSPDQTWTDRWESSFKQILDDANMPRAKALIKSLDSLIEFSAAPLSAPITMMLGSTGVGKTTTTAKLALRDTMNTDVSVAVISLQTEAGSADRQLFTACTRAGVIYRNAACPSEIATAIEELCYVDRIYIDTPGCCPGKDPYLAELKNLYLDSKDVLALLVLPAAGDKYSLKQVIDAFLPDGSGALCISKTDETNYFGSCCSLLAQEDYPVSLFTTGRNIPDDIELATAARALEILTRVIQ